MLDYIPVLEIALIFLAFMLKYNDYIAEKKEARPKMISLFLKDPDWLMGNFQQLWKEKRFFLLPGKYTEEISLLIFSFRIFVVLQNLSTLVKT